MGTVFRHFFETEALIIGFVRPSICVINISRVFCTCETDWAVQKLDTHVFGTTDSYSFPLPAFLIELPFGIVVF